jgi:hypothetical protein
MDEKIYIQTVYIPRENILFIEEWLIHHKNLGVDEFFMYDNSGSCYLDFVGNLEINGLDRQGNPVIENTKHLSDEDIRNMEDIIFKKYNAKRVKWSPIGSNGKITYNQVGAIYDFVKRVNDGFCCFIDIDEFICLKEEKNIKEYIKNVYDSSKQGIVIQQKRYGSRWENPTNVLSITKSFEIDTTLWAPKIIAKIDKIKIKDNTNIHEFIDDFILDKKKCYFKHFNHNIHTHNWLLNNYRSLDSNWVPKNFNEVWD